MANILKVIKGTELKIVITAEVKDATGEIIDLSSIFDKVIAFTDGSTKVTIPSTACTRVNETQYYVPIPTANLAEGLLMLDIYLDVVDDTFEDSLRTEIYRKNTNIKIVN